MSDIVNTWIAPITTGLAVLGIAKVSAKAWYSDKNPLNTGAHARQHTTATGERTGLDHAPVSGPQSGTSRAARLGTFVADWAVLSMLAAMLSSLLRDPAPLTRGDVFAIAFWTSCTVAYLLRILTQPRATG